MPTGYTSQINNDTTLADFALRCARNFGALISMRDKPWDAPIPESFEPSNWNAEQLAAARAKLVELETMSPEEAKNAASKSWFEAEERRAESLSQNRALMANYDRLIAEVEAWVVSEDHQNLRSFMLEQLIESRKFDCSEEYLNKTTPMYAGVEWLEREKAKALRDIEYHAAEQQKEIERTADRNRWLKGLRAALGIGGVS